MKTDILIVGGGMAGLLCQRLLTDAGADCILIEADRILHGVTRNTTAKITSQHGLVYHKLLRRFGAEKARQYFRSNEQALERYALMAQNVDCDFQWQDNVVYAADFTDKLVEALNSQKFDFICLNFANGDMVGHTGIYEAIEKAVKAVDECVADVVETAKANGYEVVMIADHGNADNAVNEDGTPNTAHSLNPVPIVVVSDRVHVVKDGILADVAPTVLRLMGLKQPAEMTGEVLVEM